MNIVATLNTALTNLLTAYLAATANPKPTYSVDGQSVSWGEYLKMLQDGIKGTTELLAMFDPVELRSMVL